jgi:hypothetical protein
MLNKIVVLIFVGVASVTSIASFADGRETAYDSTKSFTIVNSASGEIAKAPATKVEISKDQSSVSQDSSNGDKRLPSTGWLLTIALFGFVMLSNRSGV